ncbi:undecaprenyl-phosphate glucose phosphotransferase [Acuticoccus sediminis]|uniref:undecaprenyl-phosphate glucose phosphotransferase n=1 Tax=Acuticoccus sediminis TaxID=2184697 RepID=UPI001CFE153A|nr:undecaprenyl-phosphate glucose phosphotransferase [Acuticoccus sediminis]
MSIRSDDLPPDTRSETGAADRPGDTVPGAPADPAPADTIVRPEPKGPPARHEILAVKNIDRALRIADPVLFFLCGVFVSNTMLGHHDQIEHLVVAVASSVLLAQFLRQSRIYETPSHVFRINTLVRLGRSLIFACVAIIAVAFLLQARDYTRDWIVLWMLTAGVTMTLCRLGVLLVARRALAKGHLQQKIAVYGGDAKGAAVIEHLCNAGDLQYKVVGFYDERATRVPTVINGVRNLGGMDKLLEAVKFGQVDEVILALPLAPAGRMSELLNRLAYYDVTVYYAPEPALWQYFDRPYENLAGAPMLRALASPIDGWSAVAKFVEDRIVAAILLAVLSPILLAAAAAIWLDTGRPIIFRQPRRGWNGALFDIYKFRTMRTDMADREGARQATRDDPRVTRVGRFLRRTSIDELPQLINVLKGDMSLVGPRPHALGTKAEGKPFEEAVANYMRRYRVKPGITGWAQVNGWRGETDTNQKLHGRVRYDIEYIENWSFWLDLYILVITPISLIFRSKNAY